jgi:valyl-tRNA synthetase
VRTLRSEFQIAPEISIPLSLEFDDSFSHGRFIQNHIELISLLAGASSVSIAKGPEKGSVSLVGSGFTVHVQVRGLLDIAKLIDRLSREAERERAYIEKLKTKLGNQTFLSSAPTHIIEKEKEKLTLSMAKAAKLELYIEELS